MKDELNVFGEPDDIKQALYSSWTDAEDALCKQSMCAMRGHNPERECYYADQAMTFGDELRRRVK